MIAADLASNTPSVVPGVGAGIAERGQQVRRESQVADGFGGPLSDHVVPDGLMVVARVIQHLARGLTQLRQSHEKRDLIGHSP
jgi:hypothetical protein